MEAELEELNRLLRPLLGQRPWDVTLGIGSFVTLEFGARVAPAMPRERTHGEWHLWLYGCAWRIDAGDEPWAGSDDDREFLQTAVKELEGLAVVKVEVSPPALDVVFRFEKDWTLRLFSISAREYEQWLLYLPQGKVLTIGPGRKWIVGPASDQNEAGHEKELDP